MTTPTLCPVLANQTFIITKDNVDSLALSSYSRVPGTTVTVSCLTDSAYTLDGSSTLTCLSTGQWDKALPTCRFDPSLAGGGAGGGVASQVGGAMDLAMVPIMVAAAVVGLLLLGGVGVMLYVNCCMRGRQAASRPQKSPVGLFRSLSVPDAELTYSQRRHRYYPASEGSDVIDSVSTRYPTHPHVHSPDMGGRDPFSYHNMRNNRLTRNPTSTISGFTASDVHRSRSPKTTFYTRSKGAEPPLMNRVGTRQSYRTWHELFYQNEAR